jgi:hypothetical protein
MQPALFDTPNVVFSCGLDWRGPGRRSGPVRSEPPVRPQAAPLSPNHYARAVTGQIRQLQNIVIQLYPPSYWRTTVRTSGFGSSPKCSLR